MRRMLPLYVLAIFVTTLAAQEARQSGSTDASVAAVIAQYNRGLNGGDLNAVIAAFHSDGVFMAPNQPPVSGDALRQWYANYWTRTVAKLQFTPASIRVEGALAYAVVNITGTTTPKSGGPSQQQDNKAIFVLRRGTDGAWKIAHYILNSNKRA